jgi:hypothetical protein
MHLKFAVATGPVPREADECQRLPERSVEPPEQRPVARREFAQI